MAPFILHKLDIDGEDERDGVIHAKVELNLDEDNRPAPIYDPALLEEFVPEPGEEFRKHPGKPGEGVSHFV